MISDYAKIYKMISFSFKPMSLVIMKLGGSIITKKSSSNPVLDQKNLSRIASEIAAVKEKINLILIHGAGSFGHPIVKKNKLVEGFQNKKQILPLAKNQSLMNELNVQVCNNLIKKGIYAYPFQYSAGSVSKKRKIDYMNIDLIKRMIKLKLVPVFFGTPSIDSQQSFSIISGDQMMSYLAFRLKVKKTIFATNVDGIYDSNPHTNKDARLLKKIGRKKLKSLNAEGSSNIDVTGGMKGKINHILTMHKLKCQIINGTKPGGIKRALSGDESIGTIINL